LESRWSQWFSDMEIVPADEQAGPETLLRGNLPDQAALFGLLGRVRDLNLTLVEVRRIEAQPGTGSPQS
jgi:hypothetical protein